MTKKDLYKFLEKARNGKFAAAKDAYDSRWRELRDNALNQQGFDTMAEKIQKLLSQATDTFAKWVDLNDGNNGVRVRTEGYGTILIDLHYYTNEKGACARKLLQSQVEVKTDEMIALEKAYDAEQKIIQANFNAVIATVESMKNAKEAAEYLKALGFDLSELEQPPTPAMLAKRVGPRFLLVREPKAA